MGPATPRRAFGDHRTAPLAVAGAQDGNGRVCARVGRTNRSALKAIAVAELHEERPAMLHETVKGRGGSLAAGLQKGRRVESFRTQGVDAQDRHAGGDGDYQLLDPRIDSSSSS
jgi:hypothetical protein